MISQATRANPSPAGPSGFEVLWLLLAVLHNVRVDEGDTARLTNYSKQDTEGGSRSREHPERRGRYPRARDPKGAGPDIR